MIRPDIRRAALQFIADGLTLTEAAREFSIGYDYFKRLVDGWREEAGADTTYQLIAMAIRRKEID